MMAEARVSGGLRTQWFERLGASPGSLLCAGIAALGILYGFREYNRKGPQIKAAL